MPLRSFGNVLLIILLIGGNAYAQTQLPKCVLFGFGNCIGTLRFSNGDTYTGEFNYGKPNGKGAFAYGNGDSYNGTVAEGQRHGSGTYTSAAGDKYVGQFSEGKFEGVGTYYFLANNRSKGDVYAGEFSSNTFNGQGRYTHANGQVFVGSFVNGRKAVPIVAPETMLAQTEVQRLAEENAKQKAQLESQLEAERRERLAREKQAAAAAVAQADAQRIAEENSKQKAQLESQLEAERRERLAREKQAAAALVAQAEAKRIAEENAKQKAQLESQLEAERRERLAREKQAAAALVAQAEAKRIAEENAKQKSQLESQLEAERRERLAQEKQASAAVVAQAEAERIAEENAKQKAQLESQLEAERRERLAREKLAATAVVVKQDVQVAPIATPALAIVVVPAGDKAAPQPLVFLAKSESVPENGELVGKDSESKDSAVKVPLTAESRTEELVNAPSERSKWYVTGGVVHSNLVSTCTPSPCTVSSNPWGNSFGLGYEITDNISINGSITSSGRYDANFTGGKSISLAIFSANVGINFTQKFSEKVGIFVGWGYYRAETEINAYGFSESYNKWQTYDNSYLALGVTYHFNNNGAIIFSRSSRADDFTDSRDIAGYGLTLRYYLE